MAGRTFDDADVASAWNRNAALWARGVEAGFDLYRELYTLPAFLAFMPRIEGLRVIDLGCGEGSNTRRFARLGARTTGIDLSEEEMIRRARGEEERRPLGVRYETCPFSNIEIAEAESYDCVLSILALMDGPDFELAMREAHRVLVPGGRLYFSILHPCFITRAVEWLGAADGAPTGLKVGHYFDRSPFVERWRFGKHPEGRRLRPFEIPRFPRTLSDYVNAVCAAGFRITGIEEPRPEAAACETRPWLARWRRHAPLVLFISAAKA